MFHVGSTAVPDLAGKPLLDVLVVVHEGTRVPSVVEAVADDGYDHRRADPDWGQVTRNSSPPTFVHVRPRDHDAWRERVAFRNYPRDHPDARRQYERAKRRAAADHDDAGGYTDAKEPTVEALLGRARAAGHVAAVDLPE